MATYAGEPTMGEISLPAVQPPVDLDVDTSEHTTAFDEWFSPQYRADFSLGFGPVDGVNSTPGLPLLSTPPITPVFGPSGLPFHIVAPDRIAELESRVNKVTLGQARNAGYHDAAIATAWAGRAITLEEASRGDWMVWEWWFIQTRFPLSSLPAPAPQPMMEPNHELVPQGYQQTQPTQEMAMALLQQQLQQQQAQQIPEQGQVQPDVPTMADMPAMVPDTTPPAMAATPVPTTPAPAARTAGRSTAQTAKTQAERSVARRKAAEAKAIYGESQKVKGATNRRGMQKGLKHRNYVPPCRCNPGPCTCKKMA